MADAPILFTWGDDGKMAPLPRFAKRCDEEYVVGETYRMVVEEERSQRSHSHFFAQLHDYWLNLPETISERFPTPESLRKFALIKCGYADQRQIVCASKAEALRVAAFIRPMDEYAIVTASEAVVTVWTAQSQSRKAMGAKVFQESKTAVLDYAASLIGAERKAA